jgi:bleomycin hydrolase
MKKRYLLLMGWAGMVQSQAQEINKPQVIQQVQEFKTNHKDSHYQFTVTKDITATDVKNQNRTSTCWSYSSESMLESEAIRLGKPAMDLSEMWIVRNAYMEKALNYVRRQGKAQFDEGGEPHDVLNVIRKYGLVPESAYPGANEKPNHAELIAILKGYLDAVIKQPKLSDHWQEGFNGILDAYLGKRPDSFTYDNKTYTPQSFLQFTGINPDDYVEFSSFTHHPFYKPFVIEISDNWDNGQVYNLPMDELTELVNNSIEKGYTVGWATDISEKTFSFKNGIAIVPEGDFDLMTKSAQDSIFNNPVKELVITQDMRQKAFDNLTTTDDHGMHIIGSAKDQNGTPYFIVKNSWGSERNDMKGYFFCSKSYFQFKTTCVLVNKNAVPAAMAKKVGLK